MSKICLIASGKGGVGKTTVCANLGLSLARDGYRVVLIDGDMGLNNLDVVLNVESRVVYDIVDVIEGKVKIEQALLNVNNKGTLKLLASCKVNASDRISNGSFRRVVDEVSEFAKPVIAFIGVRMSWDIFERNLLLALFAFSAAISASSTAFFC